MKKKILAVLLLSAAFCFMLCACGSSDGDSQEATQEAAQEETQAAEPQVQQIPYSGSSYSELEGFYEFDLNGASYALPEDPNKFISNGWVIPDEYLERDLDACTQVSIDVFSASNTEDAAFKLDMLNQTEETKKIKDCIVAGISLSNTDGCAGGAITLTKAGVKVDISNEAAAKQTGDTLKAAYGTDEDIYSGSDEDGSFNYRWNFSNRIPDKDTGSYLKTVAGEDITNIQTYSFSINYNGPLE